MVFQHYALFPHLDVGENIAFGLRRHRVERAEIGRRVGEALELVRLEGYDRRKPNQLSGGQQQRVALARALVNRPTVLLLDEPLGALDLKLRRQLQIELKRIQSEVGITFVYVTHDQEEALTMSDRIAVMHAGRIEQLGTPEELYERPATRFVADFIGSTNLLHGVVEADGLDPPDVGGACPSRPRRPRAGRRGRDQHPPGVDRARPGRCRGRHPRSGGAGRLPRHESQLPGPHGGRPGPVGAGIEGRGPPPGRQRGGRDLAAVRGARPRRWPGTGPSGEEEQS